MPIWGFEFAIDYGLGIELLCGGIEYWKIVILGNMNLINILTSRWIGKAWVGRIVQNLSIITKTNCNPLYSLALSFYSFFSLLTSSPCKKRAMHTILSSTRLNKKSAYFLMKWRIQKRPLTREWLRTRRSRLRSLPNWRKR